MMAEDMELQGIGAAAAVPDWLKGLIRAVRSEAIQPKDARVKSLWDLLRQRQLLRRSPWLKAVLRRIWNRGLSRPTSPTHDKASWKGGCGAGGSCRRCRQWGGAHRPAATRPLTRVPVQAVRPVALKPVASVRPAAMQPVRPVQMKPHQ